MELPESAQAPQRPAAAQSGRCCQHSGGVDPLVPALSVERCLRYKSSKDGYCEIITWLWKQRETVSGFRTPLFTGQVLGFVNSDQ